MVLPRLVEEATPSRRSSIFGENGADAVDKVSRGMSVVFGEVFDGRQWWVCCCCSRNDAPLVIFVVCGLVMSKGDSIAPGAKKVVRVKFIIVPM